MLAVRGSWKLKGGYRIYLELQATDMAEFDDVYILDEADQNDYEDISSTNNFQRDKHVDGQEIPERTTTIKERGREFAYCWLMLPQEPYQHKLMKKMCQHCRQVVVHHGKTEKVKSHLNSCKDFSTHMQQQASKDNPSWMRIIFLTTKGKLT